MLDLEMDDIIATAQKIDAEKTAEEPKWLDLSEWDPKELRANLELSPYYLYRPEVLFVSPQDLEDIKTSIDPVPPQEVPEDLDFFEPDFFDFDSAFAEWTPEEEGRQLEIIRGRSRDYNIVDDLTLGKKEENFTPFGRDADVRQLTSDDVTVLTGRSPAKWSCSHKREEKDSICPVCATFGRRVEI